MSLARSRTASVKIDELDQRGVLGQGRVVRLLRGVLDDLDLLLGLVHHAVDLVRRHAEVLLQQAVDLRRLRQDRLHPQLQDQPKVVERLQVQRIGHGHLHRAVLALQGKHLALEDGLDPPGGDQGGVDVGRREIHVGHPGLLGQGAEDVVFLGVAQADEGLPEALLAFLEAEGLLDLGGVHRPVPDQDLTQQHLL
jgi:hypothetical protein